MGDLIRNLFIQLLLLLDAVVYEINVLLFDTFYTVARAHFSESVFEDFFKRIYVLLGIFILFKVAFSLIQMLANPDMLADKERGAGKLATRIVIVLGLIILVPTIFTMAYKLQDAIIVDNLMGRLILGDVSTDGSGVSTQFSEQGKVISGTVFKSMIEISDELKDSDNSYVEGCRNNLVNQYEFDKIRYYNDIDCFTEKVDDHFIYNYRWIVTTVVCAMVTWLVAGYCIDMGIRLFKMTFLELLAPICISTYVGSGKNNSFQKWIKLTISTYVGMFLKLLIIFFMVFACSKLISERENMNLNGLGYVAVILGLLVFAKNAPKLFSDLFGVQAESEGGFKGLAKTALIGAAGMAASGGMAGLSNMTRGIGNTYNAVKGAGGLGSGAGWKSLGKGAIGTLGSGLGGFAAGSFLGAKSGFGKNATIGGTVNKALMTSNANRDRRADRKEMGYGLKTRAFDTVKGMAGMDTSAKKGANAVKNRLAGLQQSRSAASQDQYNLMQNVNRSTLEKINSSGYNYSAYDNTWYDKSGNKVEDIYSNLGITDISGYDFDTPIIEVAMPTEVNRDSFVSSMIGADGNPIFNEAGYNAAIEAYNTQMAEYNDYVSKVNERNNMLAAKADSDYIKSMETIANMDKDIISTQKELGKWEKEQNIVERKTSSGNK